MSKAPAFQFYVKDWIADLAEHPLEIEGAWCRFCAKAWLSDTPGELFYSLDQWARLWRASPDDAVRILRYIVGEKIGDSSLDLTEISRDYNGKIHLSCRRMVREEKEKEDARIRQRRHYEKKKVMVEPHGSSHDDTHKKLTTPSSTASAKKEEIKKPPYPPEGGEVAAVVLPPSPEDDPDNLPGADISDLNECLIEFQDLAAAFQDAGGNVDVSHAYSVFYRIRFGFPLARVVDDLATRSQSDAWKRMDVPMNLSTYLSKKKWLDPIPKPRTRASPTPQPRTYQDQQQAQRAEKAKRLKQELMGGAHGTDHGNTGQEGARLVQHAPLSLAAEDGRGT